MHIAVCMDVAADRKQLERLLGRSTDRRLAADPSVPFYVQSYGNREALLARPFMYDLFFIDLVNDSVNSVELIRTLRGEGVTATIALCPGSVDLSDELTPEDDVLVLPQPVIPEELDSVIDTALAAMEERVPKIDIRGMKDTIQVHEDEFMYAVKSGDIIEVHLSDNNTVLCPETLEKLYARCAGFKNIIWLPPNLIAHRQTVSHTGFASVELKDGNKFRVSGSAIKKMKAEFGIR